MQLVSTNSSGPGQLFFHTVVPTSLFTALRGTSSATLATRRPFATLHQADRILSQTGNILGSSVLYVSEQCRKANHGFTVIDNIFKEDFP